LIQADLTADLENERHARRRLQRDVQREAAKVQEFEKSRFVLVLIDADADIYMVSHEIFKPEKYTRLTS
jgi:hypothetical protein